MADNRNNQQPRRRSSTGQQPRVRTGAPASGRASGGRPARASQPLNTERQQAGVRRQSISAVGGTGMQPTLRSSARIDEIRQRHNQQPGQPDAVSGQAQRPRTVAQHGDRPYMGQQQRPGRNRIQAGSAPKRSEAQRSSMPRNARGPQPNANNRSRAPRGNAPMQGSYDIARANMAGAVWSQGNQRGRNQNGGNGRGGAGFGGGNPQRSPKRGSFFSLGKLKVVAAVVVVLLLIGGVDALLNGNKIYSGVTIGEVAVGGMSKEEASSAVSAQYSERVSSNYETFFASEDAKQNAAYKSDNVEEQISYEQGLNDRQQWTVSAAAVDAVLDVNSLVEDAFQTGRDNGGPFGRLAAQLFGRNVPVSLSFNSESVSNLAKQMTNAVGTERVNYNIKIEEGNASVTEGHDGNEITQDWLTSRLNSTLLGQEQKVQSVLAPEYQPLQVTENDAQKVADSVNASIAQGAIFTYEAQSWTASRNELGNLITTNVVRSGSSWQLKPEFDVNKTKTALLSSLHSNLQEGEYTVSFDKSDKGEISVSTTAKGSATEAVDNLNKTFFVSDERKETPSVEVPSADIPSTLSLDDARAFGLVEEIYSFSTQYSSGNEARVTNIHTAAGLLNNSICKAGEKWSFNDIAGEATEDKGYMAAHAIIGGDYSDAVGGGICQVATTVFNSVYMAGYPIPKRYNHTLYISTYPTGRDAAIAYPDMDLVWQNDTSSDVLLVMSYTNSSVTATLLGISPGYQVSTETGEWQKGAEHGTTYKTDDTIKSGVEYVESEGSDGRSITVVRTVKSKDGTVLHSDTFNSNYAAKNKVIVRGTK